MRKASPLIIATAVGAAVLMGAPVSAGPTCFSSQATYVGDGSSETIIGGPGVDVIVAKGGDDTIKGRGGTDKICGGRGDDDAAGGGDNDFVKGNGGRDEIKGGPKRDYLLGNAGMDEIDGNGVGEARTIYGGVFMLSGEGG